MTAFHENRMHTPSTYASHVKPRAAKLLRALGLDVAYCRAAGDSLFYLDESGREIEVLDLLGGYGSTLLGHNHPAIVAEAQSLLAQGVPVHAQLSLRERSGRLAARLSGILQRELGDDTPYVACFANSGAEAVEVALKHAEFDRTLRQAELVSGLSRETERALLALRRGQARLPPDTLRHPLIGGPVPGMDDAGSLAAGLARHNAGQLSGRPLFLALENAFHGKLAGSAQLTFNPDFRRPFQGLGPDVRFVAQGDEARLRRILEEGRRVVCGLGLEGGEVRVVERELPVFGAFIVEPVQGEGGVRVLDPDFAAVVRKACNQLGCPLIVDEIQSGMGRTGSFLASTQARLRGDAYTLSKSLGGGLAKISVAVIRSDRYRPEFGLAHSSTFAEDDFSAAIALKALDLLEEGEGGGGPAYPRIRALGDRLLSALQGLQARFPDVIREVRGRGLLIGVEFHGQQDASSPILRGADYGGALGYLLSGYLLREHRLRVAPTASAPRVLRIEPSMRLTAQDVDRVAAAFGRVCEILRAQDALHLVRTLVGGALPRGGVVDFRDALPPMRGGWDDAGGASAGHDADEGGGDTRPVRRVAFLNHLIAPADLAEVDPSLRGLSDAQLRDFVLRMEAAKKAAPFPPVRIRSPLGSAVDFSIYPLTACSEQMAGCIAGGGLDAIREDLEDRLRAAARDGCELAGLGMYTSIVSNNGTALEAAGIGLTTGNALTVAMALQALERGARQAGLDLRGETAVVVGAAGNIASTYASLLAERTARIVLVGSPRGGSMARLRQTAQAIYGDAWDDIRTLPAGQLGALAGALLDEPLVRGWLAAGGAPASGAGRAIAEAVQARHGGDPYLQLTTDLARVREGRVVLCAASHPEPFLGASDFAPGAVVCDVAVPNNVRPGLALERPDIDYQQGGIVATPHGESLHPSARSFLGEGELFACMAETAVLGLAGFERHYSHGPIDRRQVREIEALAGLHGFRLAQPKRGASL